MWPQSPSLRDVLRRLGVPFMYVKAEKYPYYLIWIIPA